MPQEIKAQEKLEKHLARFPHTREMRLWLDTVVYSLILVGVVALYYLATGNEFSERVINRIVGDVSFLLIGLSLILSSVCYFWDFADKYIIYRKHLGLVGVGYLILHGAFSIFFSSYSPFPGYYLEDKRIASFFAASLATAIFIVMTALSNRLAITEIGPVLWRKIMRFGHVAFALALFHFGAKGWNYWMAWMTGTSEKLFPSFGLLVFLFGCVVLVLRISLWIATRKPTHITS